MQGQPWSQGHVGWKEEFVELESGRTRLLVLEPDAEEHRRAGMRVAVATVLHSHGMMVPCDVENQAKGVPQLLLDMVQRQQGRMPGEEGEEVRLWRLVRYDMRGEGQSSCGRGHEQQTWAAMGRDLQELVQLLRRRHYPFSLPSERGGAPCGGGGGRGGFRPSNGRGCIVLSGLSMGVGAALHAFVADAAAADGLLLLLPPPAYGHNPLSAVSFKKLADMVLSRGREPALDILLTLIAEGEELNRVQHTSAGFPARAMASYLRRWDAQRLNQSLHAGSISRLPSKEQLREAFAARPVPTLLLPLLADKNHPLAVAEELAQLLPEDSLVHAPGQEQASLVGHVSMANFADPGTRAAARELLRLAAVRQGYRDSLDDAPCEARPWCSVC